MNWYENRAKTILIVYLISYFNCLSQDENRAKTWYVGKNNSITFDSASSTVTDGLADIFEGSGMICDTSGIPILFSDGEKAYYIKQGEMHLITDELKGYSSSKQPALFTPYPDHENRYILFNTDGNSGSLTRWDGNFEHNGDLTYSIIEFNENGVAQLTSGPTVLVGPVNEKLAGIYHCNQHDYWIGTMKYLENTFYAYRVTENGVDETPIISLLNHTNTENDNPSEIKFSPDGKMVAIGNARNELHLYEFNNTSGEIENYIGEIEEQFTWGFSFSPNSRFLYYATMVLTEWGSYIGGDAIAQIDVSSGDINKILETKITNRTYDRAISYMQNAIDGKIYINNRSKYSLSVLNSPDSYGLDQFTYGGRDLINSCNYGLPNFVESYFDSATPFKKINFSMPKDTILQCKDNEVLLEVKGICANILWSTGSTKDHISVKESGTYSVKVYNKKYTVIDSVYVSFVENIENTIPNVFSPNNDGINDFLILPTGFDHATYSIYNRWGKQVDYGSVNRLKLKDYSELSDGLYFLLIEHNLSCLENPYKSWVHIIK